MHRSEEQEGQLGRHDLSPDTARGGYQEDKSSAASSDSGREKVSALLFSYAEVLS